MLRFWHLYKADFFRTNCFQIYVFPLVFTSQHLMNVEKHFHNKIMPLKLFNLQKPKLYLIRVEILSVFVYICPPHCERNSAHIVRTFPSSFRCVFDIVAHNVAGKSKILQYVGVRSFSQFLIIFIVHSIQFFIVSSKISKFLKLDQN